MFQNFIKIAVRNMWRSKGFSFINIAGLTLGLTACLLIGLFVWDEKQYDQFVPEGDRVYRVYNFRSEGERAENVAGTPPMYAASLGNDFPEVQSSVRVLHIQSKVLLQHGAKQIYEEGGIGVDSTFFEVFPLAFTYGSPSKVLEGPNSVILSGEVSERIFGKIDPVGKELMLDNESYIVKGVLEDLTKFHLNVQFILPMRSLGFPHERMQSWSWQQFHTYVKLKEGSDVNTLQNKFQDLVRTKVHPLTKAGGFSFLPYFQPLHKVHLYSANFKFDIWAKKGNITYVNALIIIAAFIFLIACFNFVNLATAKSLKRAKEVGVRKSIGASKRQLVFQFTGETIFLALISVIISIGLTVVLLPSLSDFTQRNISTSIFTNPLFILLIPVLAFFVGMLAGIYPALVLSRFQPVRVLKSTVITETPGSGGQWLRRGLVIIQFTLSALLIVSAIIVYRQVNYLHNKDLGFNKDRIMFFPLRGEKMADEYQAFKNRLLQDVGISSVSIGYGFPGDAVAGEQVMVPKDGQVQTIGATTLMVDHDYVKTLGLQIVAGRDFSREMKTDVDQAFMINETAVQEFGFGSPQQALGKTIMWRVWSDTNPDSIKTGQVIGIVRDFHYKGLKDKITSAVLQIFPGANSKVAVKMKEAAIDQSIAYVKKIWQEYSPDFPIEYKFLDENFTEMYQSEDKLKALLGMFTAIAIFIGCLGLFGLAAYSAERRTKEIGIRKVLGASVSGIVILLSRDFIKLVLVALVIACPLAWYFMNSWLEDFAYRIDVDWTVFVLAGLLAIVIALLTVGFQAVRAALADPVKNLRTE